MKKIFLISTLFLSIACPHIVAVNLWEILGMGKTESASTVETSGAQSEPSSTTDTPPPPAPKSEKKVEIKLLEHKPLYSKIEWNSENIWDKIPDAVLPTQVTYAFQVNYQEIASRIEKLSQESITAENKTKYQHEVENAIRDMLGNIDATIEKYPESAPRVEHLAPKVKRLASLAKKANQLGIISVHNTQQAAAWLKKYDGYVTQLEEEKKQQITHYRDEVREIAKTLGFNNEIERALESITMLDPKVVADNRVEIETQVGSILTALTTKTKANVTSKEEASTFINFIHRVINKSEELAINISPHQMNDVLGAIKKVDTKIDQELDTKIKASLLLRKGNKQTRKKIDEIKRKKYVKDNDKEESLSDNEYDGVKDMMHMLANLPKESPAEPQK